MQTHLKALFVAFFTTVTLSIFAQTADDQIDLAAPDTELLESLVIERINEFRMSKDLDAMIRHEALDAASSDQAENNLKLQRVDSQDDMGKRLEKNGGTSNAFGMAAYVGAGKGKNLYTYEKIASDIITKFTKSRKNQKVLLEPDYFYTGCGLVIDENRKRVYVSMALGKINALNEGADKKLRKTLPIKYGKKKYGLDMGDDKACKACKKFNNWDKLYEGVQIEGNRVYLDYGNWKEFKRLLKMDGDGLAIEFVQREQYPCDGPNIYNNDLPSKGLMTKPVYSKKIIAKNQVEGGTRAKSYYGPIGKIKKKWLKKLPEDYEMNLVVVQGKNVCKVITRSYLEDGGIESITLFSIYPDTIEYPGTAWKPTAEKNTLTFVVPFEQNKFDYKREDVKPLIDALKEPKYIIDEIFIEAHSSLEGDSAKNSKLQDRRAQSIISAIEDITGSSDLYKEENVSKTFGWEIFQQQLKDSTGYEYFEGKSYDEVKELMREQEVMDKLMPLLDDQRYAKVEMKITYDISGNNEEPFVVSQLKKAIEAKDGAKALKIQKYAMKRVLEGDYDVENFSSMEIPEEPSLSTLIVNKLYLHNRYNEGGTLDPAMMPTFDQLFEKASENSFVGINKYLLNVKFDHIASEDQIKDLQSGINGLYGGKVPQNIVDALNLEFQFRIFEVADTLENGDEMIESSMERIKKIYQVEGSSWQNALKLSYIFINYNDLAYAMEILEPFLETPGVGPELYYTYISAASHDRPNIFTRNFKYALTKAREADKDRYCKLFGEPYSTFQLLDHPGIKAEYCEHCK